MTTIPLVDLAAQHAEIADEVGLGLADVFARTAFVGGREVDDFEREYAAYVGAAHCVGAANGTDALELALRAVGVRPGGEVVLPANSFIATAEAVSRIGARPVLVDVDDEHLLIDPEQVARAIGPHTQAVAPVHLFGQTAFVEQVRAAVGDAVPIVEDAAQAQGAQRHGRPAGSLGEAASTSFYPGKNLGAAGDAGAVTTHDADRARAVRVLAAHGSPSKYVHDVVGMNSRLDTVQAVYLRAKLSRLEKWNELRREAALRYAELLDGLPDLRVPRPAAGNRDVWHLYVVRTTDRDGLLGALAEAGIGAGVHYPTPIHLTGAYAHLGLGPGSFPVAEQAARRMVSLPMFPHLTADQQDRVADAVAAFLRA